MGVVMAGFKILCFRCPNISIVIRPAGCHVLYLVFFKIKVPEVELCDSSRERLSPGIKDKNSSYPIPV